MRRKQIYLDDVSERALKRLAARTGRSQAFHVREALRRYLNQQPSDATDDPLERLIGLVDDHDEPDDVAEITTTISTARRRRPPEGRLRRQWSADRSHLAARPGSRACASPLRSAEERGRRTR